MVTSPAAASVNSWEFSPQEPVCGDTISVEGNASPGEKVGLFVTFEKTIPVSEGKFEYTLEGVEIPWGLDNLFTVETRGVKNLNVRVKTIVWIAKSSEASGEIATVSQSSVPPGTYLIKIDGDAGEGTSNVDLKITAYQGIKTDSNGDFSYFYNTKTVPPGNFEIKVGGSAKEVTIQPKKNSHSNSGSSSTKTILSPSIENKSSLLPDAESSLKPIASETLEEKKNFEVLTPDKDLEERKTQAQLLEKSIQKHEPLGLTVDKLCILTGMGTAVLILILYSRRK